MRVEENKNAEEEEEKGVETLMPHFKPDEMGVLYANLCQSLHIGCINYEKLKIDDFKSKVSESHNDVDKYANFFKEELRYDEVNKLKDDNPVDFR